MNPNHDKLCGSPEWAQHIQEDVLPVVTAGVDLGREMLEIGPGPGAATEWLRQRVARLTALERDQTAAAKLAEKFPGVEIAVGDAAAMSYPDCSFDSVGSFTMLHHVPSVALQDRLFREICRVLAPGALFMGSDSTAGLRFRINHFRDVGIAIDPATLPDRLTKAGFVEPRVSEAGHAFRFRACRP